MVKVLKKVVNFTTNKEAVLFWVGGVAAVGQFALGWITTGQPDANLWTGVATFLAAVLSRQFVSSRKTVENEKAKARNLGRVQAIRQQESENFPSQLHLFED